MSLSLPDASILMRGFTRLMQKVLPVHAEFHFRPSLVRNTLQLDTIPNHTIVRTYEHLLAELEQMGNLEKKTKQSAVASVDIEPPAAPEKPKVKAMKGNGYGGNGGGKNGGSKEEAAPSFEVLPSSHSRR